MNIFLYTILWNLIISIWIIVVVLLTQKIKNSLQNYIDFITAFTVWLLLGIIFLGFLPEITSEWNLVWKSLWVFILIGLFLFYLLEIFLHWHHCKDLDTWVSCCGHNHNKHTQEHKNWLLMFWWTLLHNWFHGVVLFSAFSVNIHFGIVTTIAILLHSIPQNIVNYVMNHKTPKYAYIAAFWWILWALLTFPFIDFLMNNKFYILSIISWGLLYTALADIFPEFSSKATFSKKFIYLIFIIIWIFSFLWFENISEIIK